IMPNQLITAPSFDAETLGGYNLAQVRDHTPKIHTHVEANITDLIHDAQKVKGVIIDDTDIADQKVLAYDSGTERIVYIEPAPSGAAIASIQYADIAMSSSQAEKDETITEVDVTKSVCYLLGLHPSSQNIPAAYTVAWLYNSTTVRVARSEHYS
ncbi:unnamed protein product, partial [marine sediment metagenome]